MGNRALLRGCTLSPCVQKKINPHGSGQNGRGRFFRMKKYGKFCPWHVPFLRKIIPRKKNSPDICHRRGHRTHTAAPGLHGWDRLKEEEIERARKGKESATWQRQDEAKFWKGSGKFQEMLKTKNSTCHATENGMIKNTEKEFLQEVEFREKAKLRPPNLSTRKFFHFFHFQEKENRYTRKRTTPIPESFFPAKKGIILMK